MKYWMIIASYGKFLPQTIFSLKLQSCKLYNNKHMIASTQITKTEIFAIMVVLVLKLLSRKILFIDRKDIRKY